MRHLCSLFQQILCTINHQRRVHPFLLRIFHLYLNSSLKLDAEKHLGLLNSCFFESFSYQSVGFFQYRVGLDCVNSQNHVRDDDHRGCGCDHYRDGGGHDGDGHDHAHGRDGDGHDHAHHLQKNLRYDHDREHVLLHRDHVNTFHEQVHACGHPQNVKFAFG